MGRVVRRGSVGYPRGDGSEEGLATLRGEDVERIAALCRLRLSPEETRQMRRDLGRILEHVDSLKQVNTDDVPALFWAVAGGGLREDRPGPCLQREEALRTAPDHDEQHVRVRKIGDAP